MNKVFLILFILFFSEYNQALCEEIKLRFKEIRIKFEPEKKSNIENVRKIENFLKNYLITKGDAKDFFLTITIKKYDVLVRKEKSGKELIKIFKKNNRVYIHNLFLTIHLLDFDSKVLESINLSISSKNKVEDSLDFRKRKSINSNLYLELEKKLAVGLKKKLLTNFGDFFIPN